MRGRKIFQGPAFAGRLRRTLLLVLGAAFFAWVGLAFGPSAPEAEADVFWRMGPYLEEIPRLLGPNPTRSSVRRLRVNGNTMLFTVEDRRDPPRETLDEIARLYEARVRESYHGALARWAREQAADADAARAARIREAASEMEKVLLSRVKRREEPGFGFLAYVDTAILDGADYAQRLSEALVRYRDTGLVSAVGRPRAHLAYPQGKGCLLLTFWPGEDFDVRRLLDVGEKDAEGDDPPDLPRPAGSVRIVSLAEPLAGVGNRLYVYRAPATLANLMAFYEGEMGRRGWRLSPAFRAARAEGQELGDFLSYEKDGVECDLAFRQAPRDRFAYATAIYREAME